MQSIHAHSHTHIHMLGHMPWTMPPWLKPRKSLREIARANACVVYGAPCGSLWSMKLGGQEGEDIWMARIGSRRYGQRTFFFPPFQCFLCITPIISFCPLPSQQVAHMAPDSWECWHCFGSRAKVTRSWLAVCFSLLNNITAEIFEMIYRIHTYTNCISLSLWWWWLLFLNNNYCCIIIYVSSRHSGTCLDGLQGNSGLCNS